MLHPIKEEETALMVDTITVTIIATSSPETRTVTVTATSIVTVPYTETGSMVNMNIVSIMDKATSSSDVQCSPVDFSTETQTLIITPSFTSTITNNQVACAAETQTLTISHTLATTALENHTPDDVSFGVCTTPSGSQTMWMVVAIVFLVIAVSAMTVLCILLGCLVRRKRNTLNKSNTENAYSSTIELVTEGEPELVEDAA